jgi:hypothetical protein
MTGHEILFISGAFWVPNLLYFIGMIAKFLEVPGVRELRAEPTPG